MNVHRFLIAGFALVLGVTGTCTTKAHGVPLGAGSNGQYGGQYGGQDRDRGGWDAPPRELQDIQRQGFRDGIIGAQKDFDNHRRWDPNNRDEYRNPHLPPEQRDAYRDGFRQGYQRGEAHLTGQDQAPPPGFGRGGQQMGREPEHGGQEMGRGPDHNGQDMGPGREIRRRGFEEGIDGALHDLDNRRQPNPENRDEFRHPNNVPYELQDMYREGFRMGYERGMAALTGGQGDNDRFNGPGNEIRRRGFEDGAEGAIRDWDNHRNWDPNNRDEYRRPVNVPREMWEMYQDSFRRGYQRMSNELSGYQDRR